MAGEMWTLEQTKIGQAIKQNSISALKAALAEGENVEFQDRKGNTYLHYVCTMNRPYIFHILAASRIDVNARNKHGNTALHVTALHKECGHVADLMTCGVDPFIKNKDGKTASELDPKAIYWHTIYEKYQPGIFHAVELHDVERFRYLLHCWCRTDAIRDGHTLRQFAAARKHHDIVLMLDQHRITSEAIFGVLEVNHAKVRHATSSEKCNINFLNKASELRHILMHALRLKDEQMVQLVCKAGADINLPIHLENYIRAPMYFAAISPALPIDIVWTVLKSKPDFLLKDQRGRNAVVFAMDKSNRTVPLEIIQYMMQNGIYLADRDMTGLTARDVARLARRKDVVALLDKMYIKLLREEQMLKLERLSQDGYDSMLINFNYRDTYIYACGNERDTVVRFVEQLPAFEHRVRQLQAAVKSQAVDVIRRLVENHDSPHLLANCRDKGGRSLLHLAVLHWRTDVMAFLLSLPYIDFNTQDNQLRTAYHYACAMEEEERETFKAQLEDAGCDTHVLDCSWLSAADYENKPEDAMDLDKERKTLYGMERQLLCLDKYEELRGVIRNKHNTVKDFKAAIKHFKLPIISFTPLLEPLVDGYRDLIFVAVDSGQRHIAEYLAHLGADLRRREKYVVKPDSAADHSSSNGSMCSEQDDEASPPQSSPQQSQEPSEPMPGQHEQVVASSGLPESPRPEELKDSFELEHDRKIQAAIKKSSEKVEYLTVVERARRVGLEDLAKAFERKLKFQTVKICNKKKGKEISHGVDDSGDDGESCEDEVVSEREQHSSQDEYASDFDSDIMEDL
ncbi:uncharacterized protein LOC143284184 [Babylonia areolata]|uniref:uncharacterized protein LOC143284184 n=1 Tax=Babylonia areolata TaxID=304850 RepID=UPI003FD63797